MDILVLSISMIVMCCDRQMELLILLSLLYFKEVRGHSWQRQDHLCFPQSKCEPALLILCLDAASEYCFLFLCLAFEFFFCGFLVLVFCFFSFTCFAGYLFLGVSCSEFMSCWKHTLSGEYASHTPILKANFLEASAQRRTRLVCTAAYDRPREGKSVD